MLFYVLFQPYESRVMSLPIEKDPFRFKDQDLFLLDRTITELLSVLDNSPVLNSRFFLENMVEYLCSRSMPAGYQCEAADIAICIDSNGEWFPCWHLYGAGNIYQESLQSIMGSKRAELAKSKMKDLKCPTCWTSCHLDFVHVIEKLHGIRYGQ